MEVVKYAISDALVAKTTQHLVRKYVLATIFLSCIHNGLDWDEQNQPLAEDPTFPAPSTFSCCSSFQHVT
jgi:hypothetical protein